MSIFKISSLLARPGAARDADIGTVRTISTKPTLDRPVSQACTASQFDEEAYAYWCAAIAEAPRSHRKQWEFCYIAQALSAAGALTPGRTGLGFGVGNEPLASLFAARGTRILATDLAPAEAAREGWVATDQHAHGKEVLNQRNLCAPDLFERNVAFAFLDMNRIPDDIGQFDFMWSACAFEHLGSIENGHDFIVNSSRLLKPGGIGVHTTEFNCSSNSKTLDDTSTVLFRRQDFERMARDLAAERCRLELNFDLGDQPLDQHIDVAPYSVDNHLKLELAGWVTTSFGLAIHKL